MIQSAPHQLVGRDPFLAFASDDDTLDVLQAVLLELGWRTDACKKGGLRAAVQALSVTASPAMLLIDLSESADPLLDIDSLADVCEPGTIVFAVGRVNDVALYRDLVARGIQDYLVKPVSPTQLRDALERARTANSAAREKGGESEGRHVSTAVIGTRGGVGTSMLATSLAWLLSTEHEQSTALLDLDVHFGTAALTLDLEPGRGLTDAIENPARIDGLFIERAMIRAGDKLSIMSAEAPINAALMTDGSAFISLEQEFRQSFEACVIDLPRSMMVNFPQLVSSVQNVVLTTEMTLASARDAIRILSWLRTNAPDARIILAANKVEPGASEISATDFTAAIEREVAFTIPYDHKAAINAARLGQSFAEANRASKTAAPLFAMARAIIEPGSVDSAEAEPEPANGSLLGKLDWKALLSRKEKRSTKQARAA